MYLGTSNTNRESPHSPEKGNQMSSRFKFPRQLQRDLQKTKNSYSNVPPNSRSTNPICSLPPNQTSSMIYSERYKLRYSITPSCLYKKPLYKGVLYYNHPTDHLRNQPIMIFKPALTKWLLQRPYYRERVFLTEQLRRSYYTC